MPWLPMYLDKDDLFTIIDLLNNDPVHAGHHPSQNNASTQECLEQEQGVRSAYHIPSQGAKIRRGRKVKWARFRVVVNTGTTCDISK